MLSYKEFKPPRDRSTERPLFDILSDALWRVGVIMTKDDIEKEYTFTKLERVVGGGK